MIEVLACNCRDRDKKCSWYCSGVLKQLEFSRNNWRRVHLSVRSEEETLSRYNAHTRSNSRGLLTTTSRIDKIKPRDSGRQDFQTDRRQKVTYSFPS